MILLRHDRNDARTNGLLVWHIRCVLFVATTLALSCQLTGCGSNEVKEKEQASAQNHSAEDSPKQSTVAVNPPTQSKTETKSKPAPFNRVNELARGDALARQGDFPAAITAFQAVVLADPNDAEALFRLGNAHAATGDLSTAVEVMSAIPSDHPQAGIPALGQTADWFIKLKRYAEAECNYKLIVKTVPQADRARRQLALILNRQGRRHEAATHIRELCRRGNVRQDELHALASLGDAMYDDPMQVAKRNTPAYTPIGASGAARKLYMDADYVEAAKLIEQEVNEGTAQPSTVALYGRCVAEAQDDKRFAIWLTKVDSETKKFAEYWSAIGAHLILKRNYEQAVRALLESLDRDPTDLRSIARLETTLKSLGKTAESEKWGQRWRQARDLIRANNRVAETSPANPDAVADLSRQLRLANRNIESLMWKSIEGQLRRIPPQQLAVLNQQRLQLIQSRQEFPSQSTRLCDMKPEAFAMPATLEKLATKSAPDHVAPVTKPSKARFSNVAADVGLTHRYAIGIQQQTDGFTIYQVAGGGVAALDFDQDGHVDLAFAQGGADPPEYESDRGNELFRNVDNQLLPVSNVATATDFRYTLGITVGDWNQDGFPDLFYGNIGYSTLLINQGDGTFAQSRLHDQDDKTRMPSSLAVADVNGDQLPDFVQVNYVHDKNLSKRPRRDKNGEVLQSLLPNDYQGGVDQVFLNDGRGGTIGKEISDTAHTGLGLVIADLNGQPGNEIFIGNDVKPNSLWQYSDDEWQDTATLVGCAYGFSGAATASMGIATGDFDGNGLIDLHVTNFQEENVSLYVNENYTFQDRNRQFQLAKPSQNVLGFGTQAIDYNNDSRLDLVVTNGHVENAIATNAPFRQPAQMFANLGDKFQQIDVVDDSGYWMASHLGRALARLDFNRDGRSDFVVTHLNETSALMLNSTETDNHWLQLRLIGKKCERDAIGARVRILIDGRWHTNWITAGDGYLASNERIVSFGLGDSGTIEQLEIHWPDDSESSFENVPADQRLLIIQSHKQTFELPATPGP